MTPPPSPTTHTTQSAWRRWTRAAGGVAMALLLAACASGVFGPSVGVRKVALQVSEKANGNAPIAVDLVLINDQKLTDQLLALNAADWFAKRDQMALDHKEALQVISWEVTPGQNTAPQAIERRARAYAAVVYAFYASAGPHRVRLTEEEDVKIILGDRTLSLGTIDKR